MRLTGKHSIITGAASGIGLAIARLFLKEGARVFAIDCDQEALEIFSSNNSIRPDCLTCLQCDGSSREAVHRVIDDIVNSPEKFA